MARTTKLEYENRAASTLDGAILAGDGTLDVQAGDAAIYFPAAPDFHVTLGDQGQGYEEVKVTNIAADTFTITRAQEGTAALPFADGTNVRLTVTKEYIEQLQRPLEIIEDGYQKNLLPGAFLMEWGSNGDNWPGTSFTADSAALDNAQFYCGLLSLKVVADNLELWVCSAGIGSYNIPLIIGQKYVASMYCRENAGAGEVTLRVRQDDGDNHDGAATAVDNTGWTRVYSAFTADSEMCNIQVLNTHANNKTYYCDAFQLEMVDSTVTVPSDYCPPAAAQTMLQDVDIEGDVQIGGDTSVGGTFTAGDDYTVDESVFDSQIGEVAGGEPSHLFRGANPKNYLVNGNFETWLAGTSLIPTAWTETTGACTFAQEAATIRHSIYSMKITVGGQPARLDATLRITPTQAQSRTFTFGVWVYTDNPAATKILILDDAGNDQVSATQTNAWELLTVSRQIDAATATLRAYLYLTTNATVLYADGAFFVEGPAEWAFAPNDGDGLGNINLPLVSWWDYTSAECLDVSDTDPAITGARVEWADADTDWIANTLVVPEDYDADTDECWAVLYYNLSAAEDNITLDFATRRDRLGAAIPGAETAYDHTADPVNLAEIWNGDATVNLRRVVYNVTETLQAGDVLELRATRVDDGVDTATLYFRGSNLVYVKR